MNTGGRSGFSGTHNVYLIALDTSGLYTGWDNQGSITVGAAPTAPTTVSVTPSNSTVAGGATTTLTAVYQDVNGGATFWQVYLVVADGIGGAGCYLRYDQGANMLQVLSGGTWTNVGAPSSGSPVAGTSCALDPANSSASVNGTDLTVAYRVTLNSGFGGTHAIFLVAVDATGRASYWDNRGEITVGAAPTAPSTVSVTPSSSTVANGAATTLSAVYQDANGGGTFWQVYLVVADAVGGGGCYLRYDQGANLLQVLDGGTWTAAGAPGSGSSILGSNCSLDPASSSAGVSGTDLTVGYRVTFGAGFTGAHSIFLVAVDATGLASYWDSRGSITIT